MPTPPRRIYKARSGSGLLGWFDSLGKIVAGLTGIVALISGAVTLYLVFRPPPPKIEEASFAAAELKQYGPPTPLSSYVKLAGETQLAASYSQRELATAGVYYTVPVTLIGLRGAVTHLLWSLYRATDRAPVDQWVNQDAGSVRAPRDRYTYVVRVWIQLPQIPGHYIAVIEARRGNETLDSVDTPTFPGLAGQPAPRTTPTPTTAGGSTTTRTRSGTTSGTTPSTETGTSQSPTTGATTTAPATTPTLTAPTRVLLRPKAAILTTKTP